MATATPRSIEVRLIQLLAAIACIAVVGLLMLLPYRLYERDIRHASEQAHRMGGVAHAALAKGLAAGEDLNDLVNRFQGVADFEVELAAVPPDVAADERSRSELDGTDLTYVSAPIRDANGNAWLATMHFDLSRMKRDSIRLIIDIVILVALGSLAFSAVVFWLIRQSLVQPLRRVTGRIAKFEPGGEPLEMPAFNTSEMRDLAAAVERACHARTG